jgi:hypothetical protein
MQFRTLLVGSLVSLGLVLTACGSDSEKQPDPTVTRDAVTEAAADPTLSTELAPGEVTAGTIADLVDAAWAGVRQYTSVTEIVPIATDSGSPVASPQVENPARAERNVVLPDTKRIAITEQGMTTEIVLVDRVLSKREIDADGQPGPWETIDPANIDPSDPFSRTYQAMLEPEQPPYSGLSQRQRERIGTNTGESDINGRRCVNYSFPEVSDSGDPITIVIALGADNLPCRIETTTEDSTSRTDYWFNEPITFATPAASPVAVMGRGILL